METADVNNSNPHLFSQSRKQSWKQSAYLPVVTTSLNYRFMMKLFKTANIAVVDCCRLHFGLNVPSVLWSKRVREFDSKFASVDNYLCKSYV